MLDLYAHNRATHESAARSLAETGKAVAVHPTGKRYIYLDNQCNLADELFDGCRLRNTPGRSEPPQIVQTAQKSPGCRNIRF